MQRSKNNRVQRSTNTAVLLASVAVLALSGCAGVDRTAWHGKASGGRAATYAETPTQALPPWPSSAVEAPGHDSLVRVGPTTAPSRTESPRATAGPDAGPSNTSASSSADATPTRSRPAERERGDRPRHGHGKGNGRGNGHDGRHQDPHDRHDHDRRDHHDDKAAPPQDASPRAHPDLRLCALGKAHGGWEPGSKEAVICVEAYGR
ncbi:hypothetical protein ABT039_32675 [Streptomyces lasiicapitis]|uniref:hypothetical protein n=1 Tax=Streptomyces lasiicapitis TaxID=1923961 RepID=UPI00331ACA91